MRAQDTQRCLLTTQVSILLPNFSSNWNKYKTTLRKIFERSLPLSPWRWRGATVFEMHLVFCAIWRYEHK
jgi:hypothetical protein